MRYLIQNGLLYDGSGSPPRVEDVCIENGRIAPPSPPSPQHTVIDARGLCVAPGFVDIHRHADIAALHDPGFGRLELAQGITSMVVGNCGLAPVPNAPAFREAQMEYIAPCLGKSCGFAPQTTRQYLSALGAKTMPLNIGALCALGAVTTAVKGYENKPFDRASLEMAKSLICDALSAGALGLSTGLMYIPESNTSAEDFTELAGCAKMVPGAALHTHMRVEGDGLLTALDEVIQLARRAQIPLHISHLKATGVHNWGKLIPKALNAIDAARQSGLSVTADFYPYTRGATTLSSLLPSPFLQSLGTGGLKTLGSEEGHSRLISALKNPPEGYDDLSRTIGWSRIFVSSIEYAPWQTLEGLSIEEAARRLSLSPWRAVCALLSKSNVGIQLESMEERDTELISRQSYTMLISDALYGGGSKPHPRLYGAFPRFLRQYALEKRIMPLETAIHKMTALPASRAGLSGRGRIETGFHADVCVFDRESISDCATYENPKQLARGMQYVFVNGTMMWQNGGMHPARPGAVLKNPAAQGG